MATGKHPANRLGLSIVAVLVCAPPVSVLDQAPSAATFRILENGTAIGLAEIIDARDEDWLRPRRMVALRSDHLALIRSDILD